MLEELYQKVIERDPAQPEFHQAVLSWQPEGSASGVYLVRLRTDGEEILCRLVMLP